MVCTQYTVSNCLLWYCVFLLSATDLGQPEVSVTSDGNSTAGEVFTLICTVDTEEGVSRERINIQWTGPSGDIPEENNNFIVIEPISIDGDIATGRLQFSPLRTSDMGNYTCTGGVVEDSVGVNINDSATIMVHVTSKT